VKAHQRPPRWKIALVRHRRHPARLASAPRSRHRGGVDQVRLDKWLWAARFFKTRALAAAAVTSGKVQVGDSRAKPARPTHVGDEISVRRGPETVTVLVRALSDRRGPAPEAAALYEETEASAAARAARRARPAPTTTGAVDYGGRPSKKDRRASIRLRRGG
jgi:ribosome-associated heat shock protein Hsp15